MSKVWNEHHNEQMEAARAEFELFWEMELKPAAFCLDMHRRLDDRDFSFMQHLSWLAFTRGKNLQ